MPLSSRLTHAELRARGYVVAPTGQVPQEGEALLVTKSPDYKIGEAGCWIWQKSTLAGYGIVGGGRAHRKYWERANGPIPAGWDVHHLCKVPACVNPEHLEAIDPREHDVRHFLNERTGGNLTLDEVAEIRALAGTPGISAATVARQYKVARYTVYIYWQGSRWTEDEAGPVVPPPAGWPCANEKCDKLVLGRRHKRYCSPRCRTAAGERRRRRGIYSPEGSSGRYFDQEPS
jgi:hypothetical protein